MSDENCLSEDELAAVRKRIRTTWTDDVDPEPFYSPRKLPGMEEVAPDVQGQLWADIKP